MLLAAVAQELVPPLTAADHVHDIVAILVGFSLGVALMIGLEFVVSDEDVEEGQEMNETMISDAIGHGADGVLGHTSEPSEPSESGRSSKSNRSSASVKKSKTYTSYRINEKNSKSTSKILIPSFPLAFAAAVYIDSAMDGTLHTCLRSAPFTYNRFVPSAISPGICDHSAWKLTTLVNPLTSKIVA
jgi:hypothetical protein